MFNVQKIAFALLSTVSIFAFNSTAFAFEAQLNKDGILHEVGSEVKKITLENDNYCFRDINNNVLFASGEAMEGGGVGTSQYFLTSNAYESSDTPGDQVLGKNCFFETYYGFQSHGYSKIDETVEGGTVSLYKDNTYNWCILSETNGQPVGAFKPCSMVINELPSLIKQYNNIVIPNTETEKIVQPSSISFTVNNSENWHVIEISNSTNIDKNTIKSAIVIVVDADDINKQQLFKFNPNSNVQLSLSQEVFGKTETLIFQYRIFLNDGSMVKTELLEIK